MRNSVIKGSVSPYKTHYNNPIPIRKRNVSPYDILQSKSVDKQYMFKSYLFPTNPKAELPLSTRKVKVHSMKPNKNSRNGTQYKCTSTVARTTPLTNIMTTTTTATACSTNRKGKCISISTNRNIFNRETKDKEISKLISIIADNNRRHIVIKGIEIKAKNGISKLRTHAKYNSVNLSIVANSLKHK